MPKPSVSTAMKQNPWESNRFSDSQKRPCNLWKLKVHCRIHNSPPSVPTINQINPVHAVHPPTWISVLMLPPPHLLLGLPTGFIAYVVPRDQSNSEVFVKGSYHGKLLRWRDVRTSPKKKSWRNTHCRLSATAYSIHSHLHSILKALPPSATRRRPTGPHSVHSTL